MEVFALFIQTKLLEGEYITKVEVRAAKVVDYIAFTTNRDRTYAAGGTGGYFNVETGSFLKYWNTKSIQANV